MPSKESRIPSFQMSLGTSTKGRCSVQLDLLLYTMGTFFVVLAVYLMTRGWKSYDPPEEVDLGSWHEPRRTATDMIYLC